MSKHLFVSFITLAVSAPIFANNKPDIYPFKPINPSEIITRTKALSEDRNAITNVFEIEKKNLSKGRAENRPWSGPYWSLKQGMIANPYQERTIFQYLQYIPAIDAIKPYEKRNNYVMTKEAQFTEEELARLAPSEKYDLLLGNDLDLSNRIWHFINTWKRDMKWDYMTSIDIPGEEYEIDKKNYIVANWEGICHGWAPASGVVPKPEKTVTVTLPDGRKMPFYPEDIKGLISLTWANSLIQDAVLSEGLRCKRRSPKKDKYGRYYDIIPEAGQILPRCADIHPAVLHLALVNVTGKQGRSFVFDKAAEIAVSNQPVVSYEFKYYSPVSGTMMPFNDALMKYETYLPFDEYAANRHPNTKFVVGVELKLTYADWTLIKVPTAKDYLEEKTDVQTSLYDLEIDGTGTIIGGQWRGWKDIGVRNGPANMTRPDFLWIVPKNFKNYFKQVPLPEWNITSGSKAPESWTSASITAHSFKYESSKYFGNYELCKVKNTSTGEVKEVPCEFKYPRPQPLLQVVDQLIELSKK